MALTVRQQAFVKAYIDNGMTNAAAAYRIAYPTSVKWTTGAVATAASELLKHRDIVGILAPLRAKAAKAIEQSAGRYVVTKERISQELARMAFVDARKLFKWTAGGVSVKSSEELSDDDAAAIVGVSHTVTEAGGTIKVQLADKRLALMDLAKLHGHIVEKRDVRVIRDLSDLTEAELDVLAGLKIDGEPVRH